MTDVYRRLEGPLGDGPGGSALFTRECGSVTLDRRDRIETICIGRRSVVVENNYGYAGPSSVRGSTTTAAGLERVTIDGDGRGCRTVWHSDEVAPSAVPKLAAASGLVFTYTKPPGEAWHLTAIDYRTGETVYKRVAGAGIGFNNNFAPVAIGPDDTAYTGVLGGITRFR